MLVELQHNAVSVQGDLSAKGAQEGCLTIFRCVCIPGLAGQIWSATSVSIHIHPINCEKTGRNWKRVAATFDELWKF